MEFHELRVKDMIITFAGHAFISFSDRVKESIKEQIRNLIVDAEPIRCYLGGYGAFDEMCAAACRELKREYDCIQLVYITPYLDLAQQEKIRLMQNCALYDTSIYPPIENVPPRYAIVKRNEWMITNADLIIVYVNRNYGGAYKSLQFAKRKKKRIINIVDCL